MIDLSMMADTMGVSPVFMREFRSRLRRPWAFWLLLVYITVLIPCSLYFLYHYASIRVERFHEQLVLTPQGGVVFALALFGVQLLLISLLAPTLTCTSFATERAKQTLVFMLLTPLPSRRIVTGKMQFVLFYQLLLLVATMPLCALSSLFGGLSPLDLLAGYAVLIAYARLVSAFGIAVSARQVNAARAAMLSYLGVLSVPFLFPVLLLPFVGLYALLGLHSPELFAQLVQNMPLTAIAIPLAVVCWLAGEWFVADTVTVLDGERHLWGTYAPPLPLRSGMLPTASTASTMPAPLPDSGPLPPPPAPERRRW